MFPSVFAVLLNAAFRNHSSNCSTARRTSILECDHVWERVAGYVMYKESRGPQIDISDDGE